MRSILANFPTEQVRIIKVDSKTIENVRALVESDMIFMDDASLNIEEGDIIERSLPSGAKERFEVIDRGFYRGMNGIADHYQTKVRKCNSVDRQPNAQTINQYTITNAEKVNIHSIDNSVSYQMTANDAATMEALRGLAKGLDNEQAIVSAVDQMQDSIGTKSFPAKYNAFIQNVANHMTIFSPFIPALSEMLTKCF